MRDTSPLVADPATYMAKTLLPFWAERAFDPSSGSFVTALSPDGAPLGATRRLCLTQARSVYCFSLGHRLGRRRDMLDVATHTFRFIDTRLRTTSGLYAIGVDAADGEPANGPCDFYDQAFVLFAFAHYFKASGDPRARTLAGDLLAAIDRELGDATGGWREDTVATLPRRQNPHMHLLEATQAWAEASGEPIWLDRARSIVELFLAHFFDRETGSLREHLAADLTPDRGPMGQIREPGHHMEWVWLLLHHFRLTRDARVLEPVDRLFATAMRYGRDGRGLFVEQMAPDGKVLQPTTLLWPQTEAVKAFLARHEMLGEPIAPARAMAAAMARHHIPNSGPLWINRLAPGGTALSTEVPTRLLYHLVLCLAELARLD